MAETRLVMPFDDLKVHLAARPVTCYVNFNLIELALPSSSSICIAKVRGHS